MNCDTERTLSRFSDRFMPPHAKKTAQNQNELSNPEISIEEKLRTILQAPSFRFNEISAIRKLSSNGNESHIYSALHTILNNSIDEQNSTDFIWRVLYAEEQVIDYSVKIPKSFYITPEHAQFYISFLSQVNPEAQPLYQPLSKIISTLYLEHAFAREIFVQSGAFDWLMELDCRKEFMPLIRALADLPPQFIPEQATSFSMKVFAYLEDFHSFSEPFYAILSCFQHEFIEIQQLFEETNFGNLLHLALYSEKPEIIKCSLQMFIKARVPPLEDISMLLIFLGCYDSSVGALAAFVLAFFADEYKKTENFEKIKLKLQTCIGSYSYKVSLACLLALPYYSHDDDFSTQIELFRLFLHYSAGDSSCQCLRNADCIVKEAIIRQNKEEMKQILEALDSDMEFLEDCVCSERTDESIFASTLLDAADILDQVL